MIVYHEDITKEVNKCLGNLKDEYETWDELWGPMTTFMDKTIDKWVDESIKRRARPLTVNFK